MCGVGRLGELGVGFSSQVVFLSLKEGLKKRNMMADSGVFLFA